MFIWKKRSHFALVSRFAPGYSIKIPQRKRKGKKYANDVILIHLILTSSMMILTMRVILMMIIIVIAIMVIITIMITT